MQKKFSLVILALALGAAAIPAPNRCSVETRKTKTVTTTCDVQICADYINECGQKYGGCFLDPDCGGTWPTFTAPPCSITPTPTVYATPTTTCDMSICADYVNECGQMYGGCFLAPECGGKWPSFTPPPCPTTTSETSTCSFSICVDYINSCSMQYGGCFLAPQCGGYWSTFTEPPCSTKTIATSSYPTECRLTSTICTDRFNPCEPHNIGTCYLNPKCGGTAPPEPNTVCSTTTTTSVTTTTGGYEKVKRVVEWYTWTTTIPTATPTVKWDYRL